MLNVKLDVFEGPFDLLFKLIEKHKIDIYDIPMALITEKYVEEVEAMEEKNIDNIGEFLIMAATLLKIKSKMLLPAEKDENEEEQDPRLELVSRLLEYKKYKEVATTLRQMEEETGMLAFKGNTSLIEEFKNVIDFDDFLEGVDMDVLTQAFLKIIKDDKKKDEGKSEEEVARNISEKVRRRRVFTVEMQMTAIYDKLRNAKNLNFKELFGAEEEKMEKVMTFLALLEMMKMKKITVTQESTFGDIIISKTDDFETGIDYDIDINVDKIEELKSNEIEDEEKKESTENSSNDDNNDSEE